METRKVFWTAALILAQLDLIYCNSCGFTAWSSTSYSCTDFGGDQVEVYKETMENGQSKLLCCDQGDPDIDALTQSALACGMSTCTTTPGKSNCPTRSLNGKPTHFDEILREKCTTGDGEAGYTSLCCPEKSHEGQLATAYGAEPNEFPHMAKLYLPGHCGGTIYNKRFVITAAHCIVDKESYRLNDVSEMKAIIGSNSAENEDERYVYKVKRALPHEKYSLLYPNSETSNNLILNDIALLELDQDIEFGPNVKALKIVDPDFEPTQYANQTVIAGWGTTDTGDVSVHLQRYNFLFRDPQNCFDVKTYAHEMGPHSEYNEYQEQLLCVGGVLEGKWSPTAGGGDSGGPAICRGADGRALLCGVTSFGGDDDDCIEHDNEEHCIPSIYARVSYFYDWIKMHAGEPADEKDTYRPYLYGQPLKKGRYDHQVRITSATGKSCGGTLVSEDVVITAASCVAQDDGSGHEGVQVHYGLYDLEKGKPVKTFDVAGATILDGFEMVGEKVSIEKQGNRVFKTDNFYRNNLAAIKIDGKAPISPSKLPGLPGRGEIFEEGREIAFPRSTKFGGKLSLRDFNILEKEECQKRMTRLAKGEGVSVNITEKVSGDIMCGVEKYSGGSMCDRELGGGLICKGKNGKDVLCGVQVFRLCELSIPNGFLDMSKKAHWAKAAMEQL